MIACDEHGRAMTSRDFAVRLAGLRDDGMRRLALVIGGADGLDAAVTTLSGRVRRQESCQRSADAVIEEIFRKVRALRPADDSSGGDGSPGE